MEKLSWFRKMIAPLPIVVIMLLLAFVLFTSIYAKYVYGRVEYVLAAQHALTDPRTLEQFGNVNQLRPEYTNAELHWSTNAPTTGAYVFVVDGSKGSGRVKVHWKSEGDAASFTVKVYSAGIRLTVAASGWV